MPAHVRVILALSSERRVRATIDATQESFASIAKRCHEAGGPPSSTLLAAAAACAGDASAPNAIAEMHEQWTSEVDMELVEFRNSGTQIVRGFMPVGKLIKRQREHTQGLLEAAFERAACLLWLAILDEVEAGVDALGNYQAAFTQFDYSDNPVFSCDYVMRHYVDEGKAVSRTDRMWRRLMLETLRRREPITWLTQMTQLTPSWFDSSCDESWPVIPPPDGAVTTLARSLVKVEEVCVRPQMQWWEQFMAEHRRACGALWLLEDHYVSQLYDGPQNLNRQGFWSTHLHGTSIARVTFSEDGNSIVAVCLQEGPPLELSSPVPFTYTADNAITSAIEWLNALLEAVAQRLTHCLRNALAQLAHAHPSTSPARALDVLASDASGDMLGVPPLAVAIRACRMHVGKLIDVALNAPCDEPSAALSALSSRLLGYVHEMQDMLHEHVTSASSEEKPKVRMWRTKYMKQLLRSTVAQLVRVDALAAVPHRWRLQPLPLRQGSFGACAQRLGHVAGLSAVERAVLGLADAPIEGSKRPVLPLPLAQRLSDAVTIGRRLSRSVRFSWQSSAVGEDALVAWCGAVELPVTLAPAIQGETGENLLDEHADRIRESMLAAHQSGAMLVVQAASGSVETVVELARSIGWNWACWLGEGLEGAGPDRDQLRGVVARVERANGKDADDGAAPPWHAMMCIDSMPLGGMAFTVELHERLARCGVLVVVHVQSLADARAALTELDVADARDTKVHDRAHFGTRRAHFVDIPILYQNDGVTPGWLRDALCEHGFRHFRELADCFAKHTQPRRTRTFSPTVTEARDHDDSRTRACLEQLIGCAGKALQRQRAVLTRGATVVSRQVNLLEASIVRAMIDEPETKTTVREYNVHGGHTEVSATWSAREHWLQCAEAIAELYKVDGTALAELAATFGYREEGGNWDCFAERVRNL